jgi:hypothetical protein
LFNKELRNLFQSSHTNGENVSMLLALDRVASAGKYIDFSAFLNIITAHCAVPKNK